MLETSETTADARHLINQRSVPTVCLGTSKVDEAVHIDLDLIERQRVPDGLVFGWDGEAITLHPECLSQNSSLLVESKAGGTSTVDASLITSETRTP